VYSTSSLLLCNSKAAKAALNKTAKIHEHHPALTHSVLPVPQGFLVAAVEHADGTASCVQLADGSYRLLEGLGSGPVLESKCAYRVTECLSMVRVLESLNEGEPVGVCT
jgi:hypothetical protein